MMYDELISSLRLCRQILHEDDKCIEFVDGCCEAFPVCAYQLMEKAADAIEGLSHAVDQMTEWRKNRWIPVTERLPDHRTTCLIVDDGVVVVGWRNLIGEWYDVAGDRLKYVTHWMPLPEPPKDGEE